jgi:hypothetical protein
LPPLSRSKRLLTRHVALEHPTWNANAERWNGVFVFFLNNVLGTFFVIIPSAFYGR